MRPREGKPNPESRRTSDVLPLPLRPRMIHFSPLPAFHVTSREDMRAVDVEAHALQRQRDFSVDFPSPVFPRLLH